MKKALILLLAVIFALPGFPQAQPKPVSSPTPQATAPATPSGTTNTIGARVIGDDSN